MASKKILCPVDFSECSQKALHHASELAASSSAKLFIVHVEDVGHTYPPGNPGYVEELDEHKRLIDEAKPTVKDIDFEQHYLRGNAVDEIRRFAVVREIDLIVLGTHGRTGLARVLMGSVAESLSQDAPCEIVTISNTHDAAT